MDRQRPALVSKLQHDAVYHIECRGRVVLQAPMGKAKVVRHLPSYLYCIVCSKQLERVSISLSPEVREKINPNPAAASEADRIIVRIEDKKGGQVSAAVRETLRRAAIRGAN